MTTTIATDRRRRPAGVLAEVLTDGFSATSNVMAARSTQQLRKQNQ